jgi:hypothetical protein
MKIPQLFIDNSKARDDRRSLQRSSKCVYYVNLLQQSCGVKKKSVESISSTSMRRIRRNHLRRLCSDVLRSVYLDGTKWEVFRLRDTTQL